MKKIKEYILFIEGKGISDTIKIYTDIIFNEIINNSNKNGDIILDLNVDKNFSLKNHFIDYKLSNNNYGLFNPTYATFFDNKLYDVIIIIELSNFNSIKLKEIITHELTHVLEYYKIKLKEITLNLNITIGKLPKYIAVRKSISSIKFDNGWNSFKTLIYLALDTEFNSRISQLYQFLIDLKSKDKNYLLNKFLQSETYKCYTYLEEFNPELFLIKLKMQIGENALISEINRLNKELIENNVNKLDGYKFIKIVNLDNIEIYLNNWKKLFENKNKKYLKKMHIIINEVISDVKDPMKERINIQLDESYLSKIR
jgi:hypothetical protein